MSKVHQDIVDEDHYPLSSSDILDFSAAVTALMNATGPAIVVGTALIGYVAGTPSAISASDTVMGALAKLQAQVSAALQGLNTVISNISPSLVGTGATGTQASASKRATLHVGFNESVTSNIGGAAVAAITAKICATNSATEGDWTTLFVFEEDQTVTLAIALQSIQVMKGAVSFEVPAGYFYKFESSGSGTNSEGILSGQQIVYG